MTRVGRSSRPPFKHWLLNKELGRVTGIVARNPSACPATASPFHIIDLCAGDGMVTEEHDASPGIILKHARFAWRFDTPCRVTLIERNEHTYASLLKSIALRIFKQAFAPKKHRNPRSRAYKSGVLCALHYKAGEIEHPDTRIQYSPGSAESDAWHAGIEEGYASWRLHQAARAARQEEA